ncbi:MAG: hypothetical protein Kow0062_14770 [Acidobacteriota bacterium]
MHARPCRNRFALALLIAGVTLLAPAVAQTDLAPIREKLASPDTWDRITAIRDLMRVAPPADAARGLLETAARDAHPDVRIEVVWAIHELLGSKGIDLLEKLYADPDRRVRDATIQVACRMWDKQSARDLCQAAFDDPDFSARVEVVSTLKEHHAKDARAIELFRRALEDPSEMVQRAAVFAVQAARDAGAVDALAKIARDSSDLAAVPAVDEALATIGGPRAVAVLVSLLPRPDKPAAGSGQAPQRPSDLVRAAAARALARIKDPSALPALREVVADASIPVKIGAMEALMQMKDSQAVPLISRELSHPEARVRRFALRALRVIGDPSAAKDVRRVLREEKDENVRATAALTLADMLGEQAIPDLLALKDDLSPVVRLEAAGALAGLGRPAGKALAAFLQDSNIGVQVMAIEGLGQIGSAEHVPALAALAANRDPETTQVRFKVAEALGRIGAPSALAPLLDLAGDPEPAVREQAAHALARFDAPEAKAALERLLKDPVATVRNAARQAAGRR